MQKRIISVLLAGALLVTGLLSILTIHGLQGNARVINYTGVARGATQRLIKQEMNGQANDELIAKLDGILQELSTGIGENNLIRLGDDAFHEIIGQMQAQWRAIKTQIAGVRQGKDAEDLYRLSEEYFELADQAVLAAEVFTERQVQKAMQGLFILSAVFLLLAGLLAWYESIQRRRQRALAKAEDENRIRSKHLERMSEDLRAPLNEISELMYVADIANYELLFLNEAGRKTFGVKEISGQKCYRVLQGRDAPCEFCTNPHLVPGENITWETTNPITRRHYLLKDRLIQWEDRNARLEIAFDITEAEAEKQALKNALEAEQMVMECVRTLYREHDTDRSVPAMLERLGRFLSADRAYLGIVRDGLISNDFEWCKEGISSQKDSLQDLPLSAIESWLPVFERQECVIIEDLEAIRESKPEEYALLHDQDIHSLVAAPLEQDGKLRRILGVDNPPPERIRSIASLLQTLCYFLMLAYRREESDRELEQLSYFDTLTSLYNRNRYMEDVKGLSGYTGPVGIVYLDVNGLKDINDQLGHASGDRALVECTRCMREVFEGANHYRIGGDEFVIICCGMQKAPFEESVRVLRQRFGERAQYHVAIGAEWASEFVDAQQLIAKADADMYEDKKGFYRRSPVTERYRHHNDEVLRLSDPQVLQDEIRANRFVVYFQPKVSSADRSTVGAEALVRYCARSGSLVLPGHFLPMLEGNRTISQIDFYVFECVCSQLRTWAAQGKQALPVSVNFSRSTLKQPDFVERLCAICRKHTVDKRYLEVELTEAAKEDETDELRALIEKLRQAGFFVSVDDFGTKYANLALLSAIEFDLLKLDKSLVDDIALNARTRTVVESIVEICEKMKIKVVAEGVETEAQLEALRACGVELVQGFLFTEPIPIDAYAARYLSGARGDDVAPR